MHMLKEKIEEIRDEDTRVEVQKRSFTQWEEKERKLWINKTIITILESNLKDFNYYYYHYISNLRKSGMKTNYIKKIENIAEYN